jgi:hypothetical protein
VGLGTATEALSLWITPFSSTKSGKDEVLDGIESLDPALAFEVVRSNAASCSGAAGDAAAEAGG